MNDDGPQTREEWLENNKSIMEQEHEPPEAIFRNQIETRLAFQPDIRNEDDEELGNAYVSCLSRHESKADYLAPSQWRALTAQDLLRDYNITKEEAGVIVQMANEEYDHLS